MSPCPGEGSTAGPPSSATLGPSPSTPSTSPSATRPSSAGASERFETGAKDALAAAMAVMVEAGEPERTAEAGLTESETGRLGAESERSMILHGSVMRTRRNE